MGVEFRLERLVSRYDARGDTGPVRWHLDRPGWQWSRGGDEQYWAASVIKLVTNTLVLQLADADVVDLDAPAAKYLEPGTMRGLHVLDGVDRSEQITVRQLLAHTSGLRDYLLDKRADGSTMGRTIEKDYAFDLADVLDSTRVMRPAFVPGAPGKARYSNTNYQLLGAIIERVSGDSYADAVRTRVLEPLGLERTYVWGFDTLDLAETIDPVLQGTRAVRRPLFLASMQAGGGLITTAQESARFLRSFLAGELFRPAHLVSMQSTWRRLGPSLSYGEGVMRFYPARVTTGFRSLPMVGHIGSSGAMCFHVAALDLVVSGTLNQLPKPGKRLTFAPLNLTVRTVREVARAG